MSGVSGQKFRHKCYTVSGSKTGDSKYSESVRKSIYEFSTVALQVRGWGFHSPLHPACAELAFSPHAPGVSYRYSGFLPQFKDMYCRLIAISKLCVRVYVYVCMNVCAIVPCVGHVGTLSRVASQPCALRPLT